MNAAASRVGPEARRQSAFGGLVPSAAAQDLGGTLVAALAVELHADGAVVPLLALTDAPGVVGWDPASGLSVTDDRGGRYEAVAMAQSAGLGALQATVWIEPAPPPDARRLRARISGLTRTSIGRRGGVERPLADAPAELDLDLMPERTAVDPPAEPDGAPGPAPSSRTPSRARSAFAGIVPVGQARLDPDGAVCIWAVERYAERAVLTMATLTDGAVTLDELAPGVGSLEVWDDAGTRYSALPVHGAGRATWMEAAIELTPAVPAAARALGIRVADLPARSPESDERPLAGPFTYGVRLPG